MNAYVIALLSAILLIPVFFLLRLGFTNKGKAFILGFSLLIALIGLLSKSLFAQWQTILILFLFIILTTLLSIKRMESVIFLNKDENSLKQMQIENNKESIQNDFNDIPQDQANENEDKSDPLLEIENSQSTFEDIPIFMESLDLEKEDDLQGHSISYSDKSESKLDKIKVKEELDDPFEYFLTDEINPIGFDNSHLETEMIESIAGQEDSGNNYLAELEQIILGDGKVDKLSLEDNMVYADPLDTTGEESIDTKLEQINSQLFERLDMDEMDEQISSAENFHAFDVFTEVAVTVEKETLSDFENVFVEVISELEDETKIEPPPSTVIIDNGTEKNNEDVLLETNNNLNNGLEDEELHKLLFKTMISQIQLTRKLMSAKKYEQLLCEYLHPELPISEYYTISTFLVQHYISHKQFDKLLPLLNHLEEKVTNHPMLLQEIQFFKSYYKEK